ncbi:conserved Plasmodium protein, unknown function [Plasmodium berghei]|uniref:Uncharacterized protein n=2 Tax=Plasmodium berghei TaxID=5821 RepID=A0A509AKA8_PLABA|nr:conserved Plasmodium protein, unknown function [Plasmodium berghei ANKA]CXI43928.1 conserved Plasmodium protein, unknown function [Plasmodium berghei]SCM22423.1 conserved Plasmodium protein, unknown function [Plasmodium berghei]SCN25439.1 conserved Plasmodium protein, unknown function [Plasmodium berghei]SCO60408.1 conserved Plasmodium protein, unknown function [Plasmodium berghei]SCO62187.1 conserved Plasmodium protein, unknown function [Plasmodium berghei]|eukprot:XP_034421630.1 conserved Plasmodium protein, unknown function [Plasmodium berghei ANKA]
MPTFKRAITYYFVIVSLFPATFLGIIGLMLLYDSNSLELHGHKSEKVMPSFICAGIYFFILIISSIMLIRNNKKPANSK